MTATAKTVTHSRFGFATLGVLVGLVAGVTQVAACQLSSSRIEEERTSSIAHVSRAAIDVKTENGAIKIHTAPQAVVTIKAKVWAESKERVDATRVFAERRDDNTLVVYVEWAEGKRRGSEGCEFDITLPDATGAKATTSNGAIELNGLAGKAVARSSNGAVRILGQDGDIEASTSNGAVTIEDATGSVDVETSNGRITASLKSGAKGPVELESSNGAIELAVPPTFAGRFSASTANGSVTIPQGAGVSIESKSRTKAKFELGSGGPACTLKSSNGSITVARSGA